jgi:hypothetical protein
LQANAKSTLASNYWVNQPLTSRIVKRHLSLPLKINCHSDTASLFEAQSVNVQALYQPNVLPAHVVYGHPPDMYRNEMKSNQHFASVPLEQEGRAALSASRQWALHGAKPTIPTFSDEQKWEVYRKHLQGDNAYVLASLYDVLPTLMARAVQQLSSAWNGEPKHVQAHAQIIYPSLFHPSGIQTGKHCVPGPFAERECQQAL